MTDIDPTPTASKFEMAVRERIAGIVYDRMHPAGAPVHSDAAVRLKGVAKEIFDALVKDGHLSEPELPKLSEMPSELAQRAQFTVSDPDVALDAIIKTARRLIVAADHIRQANIAIVTARSIGKTQLTVVYETVTTGEVLAKMFLALDAHLSDGGYRPSSWQRAQM